jgi:hypothetical protein
MGKVMGISKVIQSLWRIIIRDGEETQTEKRP